MDAAIKRRLLVRQRMLFDRYLDEVESTEHPPRDSDPEPLLGGAERYKDHVRTLLGLADTLDLEAVSAAIERFDSGHYGECTACHRRIGPMRLDFVPAEPLCFDCGSRRAARRTCA